MKKFSKVLALGLAATMLGGVFVGCAKDEPTPEPTQTTDKTETPATETPATETPAAPVTLNTVSMFGGTDPMAEIYQSSVKTFMEANPNVTVQDQSATADDAWKSSVLTDFAAGNEPDVIFFFTDVNSKTLVEQNKVVSIDEIKAKYPDYASNILPGAMTSAACTDGKQYAIPVRGYYEGIFCNKDLFEANGLELPTTWDNLTAAIKGFKEKGITPIAAALGHIPNYWIEHFILAEGGVAGHSNKDVAAVKDIWVKGLSHFKEFNDMGAFPADTAVAQHEIVSAAFADKKAGMFLDGNWAIGNMKDQDNTVILPIPPAPGSPKDPTEIIAGFSSGYYITRKAWDDPAKQAAAVAFVQHMTTSDLIGQFVVEAGGGAPAAQVTISGLSALGTQGSQMAGEAKASDGAIDGWLAKPAWDYLLGKVPGIAAGKEDPATVVDEVIKLNTAQ
ncbi:MAG: ABC transporter substrate-binding protein [Cellulosilyticaceae bacterium]